MYGDGVYVGVLVFWCLNCISVFLIFFSKLIFLFLLYNILKNLYNLFLFRLLYWLKKLDIIISRGLFKVNLWILNFFFFRI